MVFCTQHSAQSGEAAERSHYHLTSPEAGQVLTVVLEVGWEVGEEHAAHQGSAGARPSQLPKLTLPDVTEI